jgi:tRNA (guanine37-N1)-methyltransferase
MASPSLQIPMSPAAGSASGRPVRDTFSIRPAGAEDAAAIHQVQMRAFAEEGRLSGTLQIPPLTEAVADIELHIRTHTVSVARDGERIIGSARGIIEGSVCTIRGVSVEPSRQGRRRAPGTELHEGKAQLK